MKNKRGQFYIVTAIIIVLIISGITSVVTYAHIKPSPRTIYELSSDLKEESFRIVEYGIYEQQDLNNLLIDFTNEEFANYFLQKTDAINLVFVYGNKESFKGTKYETTDTGEISVNIGGIQPSWNFERDFVEILDFGTSISGEDEVTVEILGREFTFELKDNEMFYFIIVQKRGDETYVEKN